MPKESNFLPKFEKKSKFLVTTLILSALGHIPLMVPEPVKKGRRLAEDTADYIEVQARNISRYKYRDPKGEIDFRRKLASDLEQGKDVNYEKAYFTSERLGQGMTLDELQEALDAVDAMIEKLSNNKPEIPTQEYLRSMVAYCGGSKAYHKTKSSVLGFLASGGADDKGNCEARAKLMVIAIERLYPDRLKDTSFQYYEGHVRTLLKIQETNLTYALEGDVPMVMPEDVLDTAVESPRAMLERYANGESQTLDVPTSGNKNKDTGEGGITDTIFTPPKTDKPLRAYSMDNPFAAAEGRAAPAPMDLHPLEVDLVKDWTPEEAHAKRQAVENNPDAISGLLPRAIDARNLVSPSVETVHELNNWRGKKPMDQIWYGNVNAFSPEAMREALLSPAENMTISISRTVPGVLMEATKPQYADGKQKPARTRQLTLGTTSDNQENPPTDQIVEFVVASAGIPEIGIVAYSDQFTPEQARAIAASDHKILHMSCSDCSEETMRVLVKSKSTIMTGGYYHLVQKYPWLIIEEKLKPEPGIDMHIARGIISAIGSNLSQPGLRTDQNILNALDKEEKRLMAIEAKDDKTEKNNPSVVEATKIRKEAEALSKAGYTIRIMARDLKNPSVAAVKALTDWAPDRKAHVWVDATSWSTEALNELLFGSQAEMIQIGYSGNVPAALMELAKKSRQTKGPVPTFNGTLSMLANVGSDQDKSELARFVHVSSFAPMLSLQINAWEMSQDNLADMSLGKHEYVEFIDADTSDLRTLNCLNANGNIYKFGNFAAMASRAPEILAMENIHPSDYFPSQMADWQKIHDSLIGRAKFISHACSVGSSDCDQQLHDRLVKNLNIFQSRINKRKQDKSTHDADSMPASTIGDYMPKGKRE